MDFIPQVQLPEKYLEATPSPEFPADDDSYLTDIYNTRFQLLHPIAYKINYEDGVYLLVIEDINLWAEGVTLNEAEKELANELTGTLEDLSEHKRQNLGPHPLAILAFLQQHISSNVKAK